MPKFIEGVELTQEGMHAIFQRMGHDITSGCIYNGQPDVDKAALDRQGFMPILASVGPKQNSGHWIMLIKGPGTDYYLYDPLGQVSGTYYQNFLARKVHPGTLRVIPNEPGLNMGLCGYWVASAGLRAHAALQQPLAPTLEVLGQTVTQEMRDELAHDGYPVVTGWLRAVGDQFPVGDVQTDATALRKATEKALGTDRVVAPASGAVTRQVTTQPTAQRTSVPVWNGFSLYTDDAVKNAARHAYTNYLGKRYTGPVESQPVDFGGMTVYRQHHGLAHTLRTMAYAEVIVEEARKAKLRGQTLKEFKDGRTIADVTPAELKKILIAAAFFVTGRDDEESAKNYAKYHEQSRDAFLKYVNANRADLIPDVFKDDEDVKLYADVIEDKEHDWAKSPAHVLINQAHMVDLMRVKQPPESYLYLYYTSMQPWIGRQGTEAVFAQQREFFHATHEAVSGIDGGNPEPHLVLDPHLGRYVVGPDGQPLREDPEDDETEGNLKVFRISDPIPKDHRYMRVNEFLALEEIRKEFPLAGKQLEGGKPGMNMLQYDRFLNSVDRASCENDVDFCLGRLQTAHHKAKVEPIQKAFQSASSKARRAATPDEIAAAGIIHQIMADPNCIQDNHVMLNGERLEEAFFRELLAKCDMGAVGALLEDEDINNIDRLMAHEANTEFHSTDPKAVPVKIGKKWDEEIRTRRGAENIKHSLVYLMQNDAWYFSRVNAIAQSRDSGSTFKEVLLTTLLTPLTSKSLVDTYRGPTPTKLFRGLNFNEEFKARLINQAQTMIANTSGHLFTDMSAETFKQIKLNDFSQISSKTNLSNSTDINVPKVIWDADTIFEFQDPDGLLQSKQVGTHGSGTENEFGFYLPDDVALVPIEVTYDGKTSDGKDRHIFTFVAVKSPDFAPKHEGGFAVGPLLNMEIPKLVQLKSVVEKATEVPSLEWIFNLQTRCARIPSPSPYKTFLTTRVGPALEACLGALMDDNVVALGKALAAFPADSEWGAFNTGGARTAKHELDGIRRAAEHKYMLEGRIIPALNQCQEAMQRKDVKAALDALNSLPSDREMTAILTIGRPLRDQVNNVRQAVTATLTTLGLGATPPAVVNQEQVRVRYEGLVAGIAKNFAKFTDLDLDDLAEVNQAITLFRNLQQEVKALRNEKARVVSGSDFTDVEGFERQLQEMHPKLYAAFVTTLTAEIEDLATEKPRNLQSLNVLITRFNELSADVEKMHQEKIKLHGTSTDPLSIDDVTKLKGQLHSTNQDLAKAMLNQIRVSLNQMEVDTFEQEDKVAIQNLKALDALGKSLDGSEESLEIKARIEKLHEFHAEKQAAYPAMLQLKNMSVALVIQLRSLVETHQSSFEKAHKERTQEVTKGRWKAQWLTDLVGVTTDERVTLATKNANIKKFKEGLNDADSDVSELIEFLAEKTATELEEALGIPEKSAQKLELLLDRLKQKTTFAEKLEERTRAINDILLETGSATSPKVSTTMKPKVEDDQPKPNVLGM